MRILQIITALLFISFVSQAQPLTWAWSQSMGGATSSDGRMDIAKDNAGNIYVTGNFTGTQVFGLTSLTATGFNEIYVVKMSPSGSVIWAIKGGSNFSVASAGGVVLNDNNELFVAGTFNNVFTSGGISVSSSGQGDIFLMKLDPTNGAVSWIEKAGGASDDKLLDIDVVNTGVQGVLLAGTFTNAANFGALSVSNSGNGNIDGYLAKYTTAGTCSWVTKFGGPNSDEAAAIVQNSIGVIYLTGYYQETAVFDATHSLTSYGYYDFFLGKYTPTGALAWVVSGGGLANDLGASLGIDALGDVYVAGFISDTAYFGPFTVIDNYAGNIFMAKYSPSGFPLWAIDEGGFSFDIPAALSTDPLGGTYVTGFLTGPGSLSGTILNASNDAYIAKYDRDGIMRWATMLPCTGTGTGKAILADNNGFCFISGYHFGTMNIGTASYTSPSGQFASYVARLGGGTVGIEENNANSFTVYPNPTAEYINIDVSEITDEAFTVEVLSVDGKVVKSERGQYGKILMSYQLNVSNLSSGYYFVRLSSSKGDVTSQPFVKE